MTVKQVLVSIGCLAMIVALATTSRAEMSLPKVDFSLMMDGPESTDSAGLQPRQSPAEDSFLWLEFKENLNLEPRLVVDDSDTEYVTQVGEWTEGSSLHGFYFDGYISHANTGTENGSVTFSPHLPFEGMYEVYLRWPADDSFSNQVPVDIRHSGGTATVHVNQQQDGDQWNLVGRFYFAGGTSGWVTIRTGKAPGIVVADAVRFRPCNTSFATLVEQTHNLAKPRTINHDDSVTIRPSGFRIPAEPRGGSIGRYSLNDALDNPYDRRGYGYGYGGSGFGGSNSSSGRRDYSAFNDLNCDIPGFHADDCELEDGSQTISEIVVSLSSTSATPSSTPNSDTVLETLSSISSTAASITPLSPNAITDTGPQLFAAGSLLLTAPLSGSLTISAVTNPEPSAGILLALGTLLALAYPGRTSRR